MGAVAALRERVPLLCGWTSSVRQGSGDPVTPDKEIKIVDQLGKEPEQ